MFCIYCDSGLYPQAITLSNCLSCGVQLYTPHQPGYKYCKSCSDKMNKCQQCGESDMWIKEKESHV